MKTPISQLVGRILWRSVEGLKRWAERFSPSPSETGPPGDQPPTDAQPLPPFSGGPEEAALIWTMPPAALLKKHQLTRVAQDDSIPTSTELLRLTGVGKALQKVDFTFLDDFGRTGDPATLKGRCQVCRRVAFDATPCAQCGKLQCPSCRVSSSALSGAYLCKACHKTATWTRDNWQSIDTPNLQ